MFSAYTKTFAGLTGALLALALLVSALQPDRLAVTLLFLAAFCMGVVTAAGRAATGHNDRVALVGAAASANRPPRNSYAPALAALGFGVVVLGAALGFIAYAIGAGVLVFAGGLWLSDAWREHRLATPKTSAQVSRSFSLPFVMPLMSIALIGFVAISFSLVFFSFAENRSWIVAAAVAVLVFGGAFVLAFIPKQGGRAKFIALVAVVLAAIAGLGIVGLVRGEPEHGGEHGTTAENGQTETHAEG